MLNLKKYSHFFILALVAVFVASCEKRDEALTTDFETKRASAEKLVTEVNEGLTRMESEHAGMMRDLDSASRVSKDTAKVGGVREEMNRHMEQATRVRALVDSVSAYTGVKAENDDQLRAANDRLGAHHDDLMNEWKTLQDQHAKLQQDILSFSVNAAGQAAGDSAKAAINNATGGNNNTATGGSSTGGAVRKTPTGKTPGATPNQSGGSSTTGTRKMPSGNTPGEKANPSGGTQGSSQSTGTSGGARRMPPGNTQGQAPSTSGTGTK
jgi:hypothetical protein